MTIISLASGTELTSLPEGCAVALGFFDGVHIGHRAILNTAVAVSRRMGKASAVWMISSEGSAKGNLHLLTDEKEKLALIGSCGIDYAVTVSFDDIRELSGETFVHEVLSSSLHASAAVCGFNFRFGKDAAWGTEQLAELCRSVGIDQVTVPAVTYDGESVSSSRIRQLIAEGDTETAARLLGRPYFFRLPVLSGKMLGRRLGFPTANQLPPKSLICPPRGVYATEVEIPDDGGVTHLYAGCTNIGVCPTVTAELLEGSGLSDSATGAANAERAVAETYIEGFAGDLYGNVIKISFLKRIRGEVKFPSVTQLAEQIRRDSDSAAEIFDSYRKSKGDSENERYI